MVIREAPVVQQLKHIAIALQPLGPDTLPGLVTNDSTGTYTLPEFCNRSRARRPEREKAPCRERGQELASFSSLIATAANCKAYCYSSVLDVVAERQPGSAPPSGTSAGLVWA